jgi:hypothetical protein
MDIESIPRDITALQALRRSERYKLFLALHVDGTSDELESKFLNSSDDEQAEHLLAMLQALDGETEPYQVLWATLPLRSKSQRKNEKKMEKFAGEVEDILNQLSATHGKVNMVYVENHGILVVGHRTPPMPQLSFPGIPGLFARLGPPPSEGSQTQEAESEAPKLDEGDRHRFHAICNQAYNMVVNSTDDELLDKNLDEFLDEAMKGASAEITKSFIGEIDRLENEHAITHDHDENCQLGKMFEKMKSRLEKRAHLSTN